MKERTRPKKSLGALRKATKTKERSPDLQGQLHLQRHTLMEIARQAKESDDDEVMCNLAAWKNRDTNGSPYLTVELSPWYRPPRRRKAETDVFEDLFGEEEE